MIAMGNTITIRLPEELADWLKSHSPKDREYQWGGLVREQLERAKRETGDKPFHALCRVIVGPPDLSSRKGYSKEMKGYRRYRFHRGAS